MTIFSTVRGLGLRMFPRLMKLLLLGFLLAGRTGLDDLPFLELLPLLPLFLYVDMIFHFLWYVLHM